MIDFFFYYGKLNVINFFLYISYVVLNCLSMTLQKNLCSHTAILFSDIDYENAVNLGEHVDPIGLNDFTEITNPVILERKGEIYELETIAKEIKRSGKSPTTRRKVTIHNLDPVQYYILDENGHRTPFGRYDETVEKLKGLGWVHTVPISQNPVNPEPRPHRNTQQTSPNIATSPSLPNIGNTIHLRGVPSFTSHPNGQIPTVSLSADPSLKNSNNVIYLRGVPSFSSQNQIAPAVQKWSYDGISIPHSLQAPIYENAVIAPPYSKNISLTARFAENLRRNPLSMPQSLSQSHPITAYNQSQIQNFTPSSNGLFISNIPFHSAPTINPPLYNFPVPITPGFGPTMHQNISTS